MGLVLVRKKLFYQSKPKFVIARSAFLLFLNRKNTLKGEKN
jgi:hypothetical protein